MGEEKRRLASELPLLPQEVTGTVFVFKLDVAIELILRRDKLAGGNLIPPNPLP